MNADSNQLKDIFVSFSTQKSLVDTVFFTLVEAINQRLFPDGTYLNSVVLADIFQISRTPVQTALTKLECAGLLRCDPRGGFRTFTFTFRERIDYNDVMLGLYDISVKIAQKRLDTYYQNMFRNRLEQLGELVEDDSAYLVADTAFHYNIILSTANNELIGLFEQLRRKYGLTFTNHEKAVRGTPGFAKEHNVLNERLYHALISGSRAELDVASTYHNEQFLTASCTWIAYGQP